MGHKGYLVTRKDEVDNSGEKYFVLRIDENTNDLDASKAAIKAFADSKKNSDPQKYEELYNIFKLHQLCDKYVYHVSCTIPCIDNEERVTTEAMVCLEVHILRLEDYYHLKKVLARHFNKEYINEKNLGIQYLSLLKKVPKKEQVFSNYASYVEDNKIAQVAKGSESQFNLKVVK